jgi:DNA-directed RNA polymerase specialized sigma24 family protein
MRSRDDADELYRRHHRALQRAVASAVRAPNELIEDACQTAWTILLQAHPEGRCAFAWLRAVAIHEALRLVAIDRRQATLAYLRSRAGIPRQATDGPSVEEAMDALETLRLLASLPRRQRIDLALKLSGYSYREIQARTPGRTMTNVKKSLVKARAWIGRRRD